MDFLSDIFKKAKDICSQRAVHYGNSWCGRTGMKGIFCQIERKTDRLYNIIWLGDVDNLSDGDVRSALDNAYDGINYNAMLIELLKQKYGMDIE